MSPQSAADLQRRNSGVPLPGNLAFSIETAAQVASVGRSSIYEELKAGRLKAKKVGRRTVILADDLRAWLEAMPAMGSSEAA